jgi:hypothetical protein
MKPKSKARLSAADSMVNMAVQPHDLHHRRLAIAAARARSEAAAAGELTPTPFVFEGDEISSDAKESVLALLRPGGAYWEASEAVSNADSDLS